MALNPDPTPLHNDTSDALELALEQSHEVKAKVEACADDLSLVNEDVKRKIAAGTTTLPAHQALEQGEAVEGQVQEAAADLHQVTETLAAGVNDLRQTEIALASVQAALEDSEAALAASQQAEQEAIRRSLHDATTGLPNRMLFDDRLDHAISLADRHGWSLAVMFLDLDHFKAINDTHGHAAGDQVLRKVAKRLSRQSRDEDTVCRNGGDEFLYLLMNPQDRANVERIASLVFDGIAEPIVIGDLRLIIRPSIGIAVFPEDGRTATELIGCADAAMYRTKNTRR